MKNILVPVDFSECSVNAFDYAYSLAQHAGAKIHVVYVNALVLPATDLPLENTTHEISEKEALEKMKLMEDVIKTNNESSIAVNKIYKTGIISSEINDIVDERNIDLVVAGMHGYKTRSKKIFGSTSTELIEKANCALLLIPEKEHFRIPDIIAVACDFLHSRDLIKLGVTKALVRIFQSVLVVFSVVKDDFEAGKADVYNVLETILKDVNHVIHFPVNAKVSDGILDFIDEYKAKMLVMFHHKHNRFARFFTTIYSEEISFNIRIPLLIINDKAPSYPLINM